MLRPLLAILDGFIKRSSLIQACGPLALPGLNILLEITLMLILILAFPPGNQAGFQMSDKSKRLHFRL
ncbi:MAG: hypothetical protein KGJ57_20675 [Sphingomonadales bacterium]|nr:hypothetical protein [Sphingomonadales bacterium]MDE2171811.1 hypothetical protein [Sphingomonadales bacterium]